MKKLLLSALLFVPGLSFAQSNGYKLNGKVGNLNKPARVYLYYTLHEKQTVDSADIVNGKFQLNWNVDEPTRSTIVVSHEGKTLRQLTKRDMLEVYLEPGTCG